MLRILPATVIDTAARNDRHIGSLSNIKIIIDHFFQAALA